MSSQVNKPFTHVTYSCKKISHGSQQSLRYNHQMQETSSIFFTAVNYNCKLFIRLFLDVTFCRKIQKFFGVDLHKRLKQSNFAVAYNLKFKFWWEATLDDWRSQRHSKCMYFSYCLPSLILRLLHDLYFCIPLLPAKIKYWNCTGQQNLTALIGRVNQSLWKNDLYPQRTDSIKHCWVILHLWVISQHVWNYPAL